MNSSFSWRPFASVRAETDADDSGSCPSPTFSCVLPGGPVHKRRKCPGIRRMTLAPPLPLPEGRLPMRMKPVLFTAACMLLATSPALAKHWHEGEKHGKHAKHGDRDDERCYFES